MAVHPSQQYDAAWGALLRTELGLVPKGLGGGKFKFAGLEEERLTNWMREHIQVGVCPVDSSQVEAREQELVRERQPPLNLTYSKNPTIAEIKRLRQAFVHSINLKSSDHAAQ